MKKNFKVTETELEKLDFSIEITNKRSEKSLKLYKMYQKQYKDWKEILTQELEINNNKSILIYMMFITVEIYIKSELIRVFNIDDINRSIENIFYKPNKSNFVLNQIGHDLNYLFNFMTENPSNPIFQNLSGLLMFKEKIKLLELEDDVIKDYTSYKI